MADPDPGDSARSVLVPDAERVLSPELRMLLYLVAGILVALWLVIRLYGPGSFCALVAAVITARWAYGWRRSLNVAFATGLAVFVVALVLWGSLLQARWDDATATTTHPPLTGQ